jgi:hypothetical protein
MTRTSSPNEQTEQYPIKNRWSGEVIVTAEISCSPDTLRSIKLGLAVKAALKARADLARANLAGANLADAYLAGADLAGADLADAKGFIPERTTHLASIKFLPVCHAFKVVNEKGEGHINGGLKYRLGQRVTVKNADSDPATMCSKGIHVADLPWCLREWREGYRILLIEHSPDDIACVPYGTDGKYRLKSCTPIKDITDELRECGALPALQVEKVAA